MAAFLGVDPITYMRLDATEARVLNDVLEELAILKSENERRSAEFLANEIANQVISRIR